MPIFKRFGHFADRFGSTLLLLTTAVVGCATILAIG
jgi:hypothetical protein